MTEQIDPVAGKTVSEVFGEIVWLMTQDPAHKNMALSDLEWLVMPPILLRQFRITYAPVVVPQFTPKNSDSLRPNLEAPSLQPVAVELYAMVSGGKAAELLTRSNGVVKLKLAEWRSGNVRQTILTAALPQVGINLN